MHVYVRVAARGQNTQCNATDATDAALALTLALPRALHWASGSPFGSRLPRFNFFSHDSTLTRRAPYRRSTRSPVGIVAQTQRRRPVQPFDEQISQPTFADIHASV